MYNASNNARSRLTQGISSTDTILVVEDGSLFPEPPFLVSIGDEIIEVGGKTGSSFGGLTRGAEDTVPASHQLGVLVENRFTAGTYQLLKNTGKYTDQKLDAHTAENVSNGVHGLVMETGTFTPTITGSLVSGSNTYSSNIGKYNRVGNIVFFDISIIMATKDANIDGNLQISGLPFVRVNDGTRSSVTIGSFNYVTFPSDVLQIGGRVDNGQNKIFLFGQKPNNLAVNVQTTNIANNSAFFISGNYEI